MALPTFKQEYNLSGESLLPHRPPFLFVDKLVSADETGARGEYTFTLEKNAFFQGHFPDFPVVPGVILIEAMSQVAGAAVVARKVIGEQVAFALASVQEARFRAPFRPGDTLVTIATTIRERPPMGVFSLKGYVNGEPDEHGNPAVECTVKCMMGKAVAKSRGTEK